MLQHQHIYDHVHSISQSNLLPCRKCTTCWMWRCCSSTAWCCSTTSRESSHSRLNSVSAAHDHLLRLASTFCCLLLNYIYCTQSTQFGGPKLQSATMTCVLSLVNLHWPCRYMERAIRMAISARAMRFITISAVMRRLAGALFQTIVPILTVLGFCACLQALLHHFTFENTK
jgi:hypothetical protein